MRRIEALLAALLLLLVPFVACSRPLSALSAEELTRLGEKHLQKANYAQAIACFDRLLEVEPRNPRSYTGLTAAYIGQDEISGALTALEDGREQLSADAAFLQEAAGLYETMLAIEPKNPAIYAGLSHVYVMLEDTELALDALQKGLDEQPDHSELAELYASLVMPKYAITQTCYQELRADDGTLLACNEYWQPVFSGNGDRIRMMNSSFAQDLAKANLDSFSELPEQYDTRQGYAYEDAQSGRVGGYREIWEESYRMGHILSFTASGEWDGLGAHGGFERHGRTFDASTGEQLRLSDCLKGSPEEQVEILYNEYLAYQADLDDGYFAELAKGDSPEDFDGYFAESVKEQCGENAVFWLADDGIHVYFHQYTFYYAAGSSELVIPYTRLDLVREALMQRYSR